MEIREMTREDVEQVYSIEEESFSSPWTKEAITMEVESDNRIYYVAVENDKVIGYAGLWRIFDEGHITNIAIKKESRGNGVGHELLTYLIEKSQNKGIEKYTLEVRVSNQAAINLYHKLGFEEVGIRKGFYDKPKEDALIMWKQ